MSVIYINYELLKNSVQLCFIDYNTWISVHPLYTHNI